MTPLFREYLDARRLARSRPDLAAALKAYGLPDDGYGLQFVEIDQHHYALQLQAGGLPSSCRSWDGELQDLVATGLATRQTRTREGIATGLGREWIERAKVYETAVRLFGDPIEWLGHRCCGAVVIDWRAARYELADLPGIVCETELLAKRVDRALRQPSRLPQLFVREAHRAAA
jgi:hypothetical protein